jgi:hypothetical protein
MGEKLCDALRRDFGVVRVSVVGIGVLSSGHAGRRGCLGDASWLLIELEQCFEGSLTIGVSTEETV